MKLKIFFAVITLLLISALSTNAYAQPGGGQTCDDGSDFTPDGCPLDTWVAILVVAASVFAAYKLYRRNRVPC